MPAARHLQIQVEKLSLPPFFFCGPHLLIRVTSIPLRASMTASAFFASFLRLTPCSVSPGWLAAAGPAPARIASPAIVVISALRRQRSHGVSIGPH